MAISLVVVPVVSLLTKNKQTDAQNGVARIEQGEIDGQIGLCTGVGLYVGILCTEQLADALDGKFLYLIHHLATAIVALAGIALGIFVC